MLYADQLVLPLLCLGGFTLGMGWLGIFFYNKALKATKKKGRLIQF